MKNSNCNVARLCHIVVLLFILAPAVRAATNTVTSAADDFSPGTLRATVLFSNPGDTVIFSAALSGQTITLTNGTLELTTNIAISGAALSQPVSLSAGGSTTTVLVVDPGVTAALTGLVIANGNAMASDGGGIGNAGTLTLINSMVINNTAATGGGIFNFGTLVLKGSTVAYNSATGGLPTGGGGIENDGGTLTLINSTVATNTSTEIGAGGIENDGGTAILVNSTVANNYAPAAVGGFYNGAGNTLILTNSIISANFPDDLANSGTVQQDPASNLIGVPGINLLPLGYYGGPTETMPPWFGSPAIDAGDNSVTNSLSTDQRGSPRKFGSHVDIGAVELQVTNGAFNVVNEFNDDNSGYDNGLVSLRKALAYAPTGSTITFATNGAAKDIVLANGQLYLGRNLNIDASALASAPLINANGQSRVLYIDVNATVSLSSLDIINGNAAYSGSGGGGIYNAGNLTLKNTLVENNTLYPNPNNFPGGGIANEGTLTLSNSTVTGNGAGGDGAGGGIENDYVMTMVNSTVSGNEAEIGGGIYNTYALEADNSTFVSNSAYLGGAIENVAAIVINNSTVSANSTVGGGGAGIDNENGGTLNLTNCILSGNLTAGANDDIQNTATIQFGRTNLVGVSNINLAPLGLYGGPTPTMPPLAGSPAIDAGDDSVTNFLSTDQRGSSRLFGTHVDIGAVEYVSESSWAVGNGNWDLVTHNWKDLANHSLLFYPGQTALFDDTASGASPIIVTNRLQVTNGAVVFNNSAKNYTLTGQPGISNNVPITKMGAGTLTFTLPDVNYGGNFILAGGTLALPSGAALGSATNGALLVMSNNTAVIVGTTGAFLPTVPVLIGAGANVTNTADVIGSGFGGSITSADPNGVINDNSSMTYSGNFQGFTGTLNVNSGTTVFSNGGNSATNLGSSNAQFVVNGTLQPKNQNTIVHLGALSGTGMLGGSQTTTSANTTTYWIGELSLNTTFGGTFVDNLSPNTNVAITKLGTAVLTLTNNSPNTGPTTVSNGTLLLLTGSSLSNSAVTVANNAIAGVTVATAGGSCAVSNLTCGPGVTYLVFHFGANAPASGVAPLQVLNSLAINGPLAVIITGTSSNFSPGTYPLASYAGALIGLAPTLPYSLPASVNGYLTNITTTKSLALVVTNGAATLAGTPPLLSAALAGNGSLKLSFTNTPGASLTVWGSTNLALSFNQWSNLGSPTESPAGTFTFIDTQTTNSAGRFYRVTSP